MKRLTMMLSAALIGIASAAVAADDSTKTGGGPSGPGSALCQLTGGKVPQLCSAAAVKAKSLADLLAVVRK